MFTNIGEKVGVAVLSAVILGALALLWQTFSDGTMIKLLGGVPESELQSLAGHPHQRIEAASIPTGAVVAFDTDSCPDGWSRYAKAHSRVIIGATQGADFVPEFTLDSFEKDLSLRKLGEHGGSETQLMAIAQLPEHFHRLKLHYVYNNAEGSRSFTFTGQEGPIEEGEFSQWTFASDRKAIREDNQSETE